MADPHRTGTGTTRPVGDESLGNENAAVMAAALSEYRFVSFDRDLGKENADCCRNRRVAHRHERRISWQL